MQNIPTIRYCIQKKTILFLYIINSLQMKSSIKILAFLTLFLLNGCNNKDNDEIIDPEIIEEINVLITTNSLDLKDVQIGVINVTDFIISQDTYNAKFGTIDIILAKINDSSLSFIVPPNTAAGTYNLSVDFASNSLAFKVTNTTLPNTPENVILDFVGNYEDEINETIALFSQGNAPPELLAIKDNIDKALLEINNLSDNDKIIAAKFIENNTSHLNQLELELSQQNVLFSPKSQYKSCDSPRCYFAYGTKVLLAAVLFDVGGVAAIIGASIIGIDAIISLMRGKQSVLVSKVKKVAYEGLSIAYFAQNYLAETTFNSTDNFLVNFKTSDSKSNKIDNKTTISFKIKPTYRTLNAQDASSTDDTAKTFVAAYIKFKGFWDANFASDLGAFPNFNNNEEQRDAEELSQFSLKITNNSENVTGTDISGSATSFSSTFTNKTDVDQDFTTTISFTDGDITATATVSFKIGFDEIFLKEVSGNNQTGTQDNTLEKPIVVKVVDADDNAIKDVNVEFNITKGEGKLSTSETKTNSDGLAQVSWTLGDNLDDQSLEVFVKNSDGENISSSPLIFKATSEELELVLEKFSGDNQTGEQGKQLPETLKVYVKDKDDNLIDNVTVYYTVTSGGGSIQATDVSAGGFSEATWTLGNNDTQTVEAAIKDSNGNIISAVIFNASFNFSILGKWKNTNSDSFNITFYDNGFQDILWDYNDDGVYETEGRYSWNWTNNNKTHINLQVDNDGNSSDWIVAEITLTLNTLVMKYEGTSSSFIKN